MLTGRARRFSKLPMTGARDAIPILETTSPINEEIEARLRRSMMTPSMTSTAPNPSNFFLLSSKSSSSLSINHDLLITIFCTNRTGSDACDHLKILKGFTTFEILNRF
jgi:hypothetical protein